MIGKRYGEGGRFDGMFGKRWGEWFQNRRFAAIEERAGRIQRYGCPRFTRPDEKGRKILDICHYIRP